MKDHKSLNHMPVSFENYSAAHIFKWHDFELAAHVSFWISPSASGSVKQWKSLTLWTTKTKLARLNIVH